MGQPRVVLPRIDVAAKNPVAALSEIRTSLSETLSSLEGALPNQAAIPGLSSLPNNPIAAFPQPPLFTEFIKSLEAGLPAGLPKISGAVSGQGAQRGAITEEKPPKGGVASRGSL